MMTEARPERSGPSRAVNRDAGRYLYDDLIRPQVVSFVGVGTQ